MDTDLFFLINRGMQNSLLDVIMPFITTWPFVLFAVVAVPVFFKYPKKSLFVVGLCLVALAVGDASSKLQCAEAFLPEAEAVPGA